MADPNLTFKKITLTLVSIAIFATNVFSAPAKSKNDAEGPPSEYVIIDQSQNGSENYRVDVKDVIVVWAPPETLLGAAALLEPGLFDNFEIEFEDAEKPSSTAPPEKIEDVELSSSSSSTTTASSVEVIPDKLPFGLGSAKGEKLRRPPSFLLPLLRRKYAQ